MSLSKLDDVTSDDHEVKPLAIELYNHDVAALTNFLADKKTGTTVPELHRLINGFLNTLDVSGHMMQSIYPEIKMITEKHATMPPKMRNVVTILEMLSHTIDNFMDEIDNLAKLGKTRLVESDTLNRVVCRIDDKIMEIAKKITNAHELSIEDFPDYIQRRFDAGNARDGRGYD